MEHTKNNSQAYTYVALGDSLANGVGAKGQGYPQQLLAKLQQHHQVKLSLHAKNGQTSTQLLKRWPTFQTDIANANIITLNIGGNDLRLTWRLYGHKLLPKKLLHKKMDTALTILANNCNVMADNITKTAPRKTKVVILGLYNPYQVKHPETNYFIERANQQLEVICANHGFLFINTDSLIKKHHLNSESALATDNLHLNQTGYHLLAQTIYRHLHPQPLWKKLTNALMRITNRIN